MIMGYILYYILLWLWDTMYTHVISWLLIILCITIFDGILIIAHSSPIVLYPIDIPRPSLEKLQRVPGAARLPLQAQLGAQGSGLATFQIFPDVFCCWMGWFLQFPPPEKSVDLCISMSIYVSLWVKPRQFGSSSRILRGNKEHLQPASRIRRWY